MGPFRVAPDGGGRRVPVWARPQQVTSKTGASEVHYREQGEPPEPIGEHQRDMNRKSNLRAFWKELRRRRVVRSGGFYVAAAFIMLQLGEIVLPAFNAPDWVLQSLVVLLLLGLPVVLAFAWVYDMTPEGLERTAAREAVRVSLAPRVALLAITVVMAGLGALWFQRNARTGDAAGSAGAPGAQPEVLALAQLDTTVTAIAVLPLVDLTGGDDLFSRQLHDEIITLVSKLTTLRVVSRTSVERYRDTDKLLPEIASELGVQRVVTGSVAMAAGSDSVRISVQLLDAPTDTHLHTVTYQREMRDILRLQSEIAVDIARTVVGELDAFAAPEQLAQVDPEAYRLALHGQQALELGTSEGRRQALGYLDQAVDRDPSFAFARVLRFGAVLGAAIEGDTVSQARLAMAQEDWAEARELGGVDEEVAAAELVAGQAGLGLGPGAGWLEPTGVGAQREEAGGQVTVTRMTVTDSLTREVVTQRTSIGRQFRDPFRESFRFRELGQYDSAAIVLRAVLEGNDQMIPAWAALEDLHLRQRDYAGAVGVRDEWIRAVQDDPAAATAAIESLHATFDAADPRSYWEWRQGRAEARQTRGERVSQVEMATIAMHLGDRRAALDHLEAATRTTGRWDPGLGSLGTDPLWDSVRRHPRFRELQRQVEEYIEEMRQSRGPRGQRGSGPGGEGDGRRQPGGRR